MPNILNIALHLMGFIETDEDDGDSIVVSKTESRTNNKKIVSLIPKTSTSKPTIVHITPEAFDDVIDITKRLQNKTIVTMNLASLDIALSQRIVDFASGAVYALDGGVMKLADNVYLLANQGVALQERGLNNNKKYGV